MNLTLVAALFKGGRITDRAVQYRPINILQGLFKLFTMLIDQRLRRGLLSRIYPS